MLTTRPRRSSGPAQGGTEPCAGEGHSCEGFGVQERPRYFPRQLITPGELTLEADYFRDRLRRHNVYLHGWGVVCGALVCVVPAGPGLNSGRGHDLRHGVAQIGGGDGDTEPWVVCVQPGYILGPYGDEILIDCPRTVHLRVATTSGCASDAADDLSDPWCSEVYVDRPAGPLFVAVRYRQFQTRLVRAQPAGCGCDDSQCEYSRYRDGYEIGILDECRLERRPTRARGAPPVNPACPPCPDSPWVVLAEVTVDADGTITHIENCSCRRIVATSRDDWLMCQGADADYEMAQPAVETKTRGAAGSAGPAPAPTASRAKPR